MKLALTITTLLLTGCSMSHVVSTSTINDRGLTCDQIKGEIAEAEQYKQKASSKKGFTGTNAAAAVLFWPAMIATYSSSNEAIEAANTRINNLEKLYDRKKCK